MIEQRQATKAEYGIAVAVAIATAVLLAVPYLLGYWLTQDGLVFTGLIMNPEDSQTYWAKMVQGAQGAWLYRIPFTSEPHDAELVGVFYVWLGQLARWTGWSLTAVWHGSRFLFSILLFIATFDFINQFVSTRRWRWTAFLLAIFGSGLGWVLFIFGANYWLDAFPVDFKQPGAHLFFTALTFPHIILGTVLILLSVSLLWQMANAPPGRRGWWLAVAAAAVHLLLGIAYPFLIYLVGLTAVIFYLSLLLKERRILWRVGWQFAVAFLLAAPLYLYYAAVLQNNAVFEMWSDQAGTPSAPWPHYLIAYGLYLLLGGLFWWKRREQAARYAILYCWVGAVLLLLYAPLNPQRRFVQGVQVPLSILAAGGLLRVVLPALQRSKLWQRLLASPRYESAKLTRLLLFNFLLLMSLSNLYLWVDISRTAALVQPYPLFRPVDEQEAVSWLMAQGELEGVILAAYQSGNWIGGQTGRPVVLGHWAETTHFERNEADVARFFAAETAVSWRQAFIEQRNIGYVWVGPQEAALGSWQGETAVYQNDTITIYRLENN